MSAEIALSIAALDELGLENLTLGVAIDYHCPGNSKSIGKSGVDSGVSVVLKIDNRETVLIQVEPISLSQGLEQKIFGWTFYQDPLPCEKYLPTNSSTKGPKESRLLGRNEYATGITEIFKPLSRH